MGHPSSEPTCFAGARIDGTAVAPAPAAGALGVTSSPRTGGVAVGGYDVTLDPSYAIPVGFAAVSCTVESPSSLASPGTCSVTHVSSTVFRVICSRAGAASDSVISIAIQRLSSPPG